MALLEYPVTKPISVSLRTNLALVAFTVLFVGVVTIINIIAVGYEVVPVIAPSYHSTDVLWYEKFLPRNWLPKTLDCNPATINIMESFVLQSVS